MRIAGCLSVSTHMLAGRSTSARVVAGAFQLYIDGPQRVLRLIEWGTNFRSRRLQMPYGDQALFLKAETFRSVGGFPDLPIMEDFELVRRLSRRGRIAVADAAVTTSARRWAHRAAADYMDEPDGHHGLLSGVSPERLAGWYCRGNETAIGVAVGCRPCGSFSVPEAGVRFSVGR